MRRALLVVAALVSAPHPAGGSTSAELPYPPAQVWNTAMRMLRVDLGFEIVERDEAAGYVIFTYRDNRTTSPGSMELVRIHGDSRPTKVVFQIRDMPRYHELNLVDRLGRKLRQEYGDPPRPPTKRPPDAGPPAKRRDARPD